MPFPVRLIHGCGDHLSPHAPARAGAGRKGEVARARTPWTFKRTNRPIARGGRHRRDLTGRFSAWCVFIWVGVCRRVRTHGRAARNGRPVRSAGNAAYTKTAGGAWAWGMRNPALVVAWRGAGRTSVYWTTACLSWTSGMRSSGGGDGGCAASMQPAQSETWCARSCRCWVAPSNCNRRTSAASQTTSLAMGPKIRVGGRAPAVIAIVRSACCCSAGRCP